MGVFKKHWSSDNLPRRAYYPSGPWINGIRPPDYNSSSSEKPKKKKRKLPNPDPGNYKIVQVQEIEQFLVIRLNYPDCTNYEGNKILVFRDVTLVDLMNQRLIDPHFFQDSKYKSPIARFVPTEEGWKMAQAFCKMMVDNV